MKKLVNHHFKQSITLLALLTFFISSHVTAKDYSLDLSDPDKTATIRAELIKGSITVQGYNGKTIEISATSEEPANTADQNLELDEQIAAQVEKQHHTPNRKRSTEGLAKVTASSMQLDIVESNNVVRISSANHRKSVNLSIKVPFDSKLKLELSRGGDIKVSGVTGSLELANHRGAIYAEGVVGPIVAETHRKDIEVIFDNLDQKTPSSLTSHRGSIDISINEQVKSDIKVQTIRGEVYSGLPTSFVADNEVKSKKSKNSQHITMGGMLGAKANGGGQELTLTTYRGDIYIRTK